MPTSNGMIAYALDRAQSGIGRYTRELIAALGAEGHAPVILSAGSHRSYPQARRLRASGLLPALLTLGQLEIGRVVNELGLELVHDPSGVMAHAFTPVRRVVTVHDAFPFVTPATSTALERLIYRLWLPLALRRADAVITVSECSKRDILRYLPIQTEQVVVVPNAVSASYRPLTAEEIAPGLGRHGLEPGYLLFVGSVEPRKNLLRLLEAFALARREANRARLVIVGARNAWIDSPVGAAVERLGLGDWVRFTGYVAEADLPALYNGAAGFAFPSLYEGFGLPVLEAMACGTPVVTSNVSSLPEVAGDAALLVDPCDTEALARSLQGLLTDADLRADLRERGLRRAALFSWGRTARETVEVYRKVRETK
jgi:glycosyltransferase involved in cell wall biosynthesis